MRHLILGAIPRSRRMGRNETPGDGAATQFPLRIGLQGLQLDRSMIGTPRIGGGATASVRTATPFRGVANGVATQDPETAANGGDLEQLKTAY